MNVQSDPSEPAAAAPAVFSRLRRRLAVQRIAGIQFVYGVLSEIPHVTLCATPIVSGGVITISKRMRHRLIRAFCDWMASHESGWLAGPDCVGVLTWDLSTAQFTHRHSGYTQLYFSRAHLGEPPSLAPRAASSRSMAAR